MIVLTLPGISREAKRRLRYLGADVWDLPLLSHETKIKTDETDQRKLHLFSKLLLWNMTEFDAVLYLDSDTMVLQNIDDIFRSRRDFMAAADVLPGIFNTGKTYKRILFIP